MALTKLEKKRAVDELNKELAQMQTLVVAEYRGIKVDAITKLRGKAREQNTKLKVIKNTLARIGVKNTQFEPLADLMKGPLIYAYSKDPISAAKVLNDFAKQDSNIQIKAGFFNNTLLNVEEVQQLASIPSKEELLSKLLFLMKSPISGFARALAAIAEQKQSTN